MCFTCTLPDTNSRAVTSIDGINALAELGTICEDEKKLDVPELDDLFNLSFAVDGLDMTAFQ